MQPIEAIYQTGVNLYVVLHNPNGQVWNTNSQAWEAYNSAHWSNYAISLTEQTGSGYYSAAMPSGIGAVLPTEVTYVQAGGSPTLGDAPAFVGQSQGTNVAAVVGDVQAADNLEQSLSSEVPGAAATGTLSLTQATTNLTNANAGAYRGRALLWISGALAGIAALITDYATAGGLLTFTPVPVAPSNGDKFIIV